MMNYNISDVVRLTSFKGILIKLSESYKKMNNNEGK